VYVYFKTKYKNNTNCGWPSALPGYLALPSLCVPDVISALACGFQTKNKIKKAKVQKNERIHKTKTLLKIISMGYLVTAPPSVCVPYVIGALAYGFRTKQNK